MEIRLAAGYMPNITDNHWPVSSYALHFRYIPSILINKTHLPRCKIRMTPPKNPRQHRILLFLVYVLSHRPRNILRLLYKKGNLKSGRYTFTSDYVNRLRGLRTTLRSNVFLRGHSNNQPYIRSPIHRNLYSSMIMRRVFGGQCHSNSVLRLSLLIPIYNSSLLDYSLVLSTPDWVEQTYRNRIQV